MDFVQRTAIEGTVEEIGEQFAQIALQLRPLARHGFGVRLSRGLRDRRLRRIARLMGIAAIGASVYQINVLVGTLLASLLERGSVAYLYYANRIMELPLGIFAFAVSNVMLPSMSSASARTDMTAFATLMQRSLLSVLLFLVPSTVGICVLAEPIFAVLFMRGAFDPGDALLAGGALRMYAVGLWAVGCSRIYTQAFYALQQPGAVVKVAWVTLGLNVVLCLLLMPVLAHAGIALAGSLAVIVQLMILRRMLRRRGVAVEEGLGADVLRMVAAAAVMGLALLPVVGTRFWSQGLTGVSLALLMGAVGGGAALYFALLRLLGFHGLRR